MQFVSHIADRNWSLIGSFMVGATGIILGVWNRIEQIRETKRKRQAELPKGELIYRPGDQKRDDGWTRCQVLFFNPAAQRFDVLAVEAVTRGLMVAPELVHKREKSDRPWDPPPAPPPEPDLQKVGNAFDSEWRIDQPKQEGHAAAQTHFWFKADGRTNIGKLIIRFRCEYRFNTRRSFQIDCRLKPVDSKPKISTRLYRTTSHPIDG
jgi:hypothetical protein